MDEHKNEEIKAKENHILSDKAAYGCMVLLMLAAEAAALLLIGPSISAGLLAFDNPESLWNVVLFIFLMLVFTAVLLLLIRRKAQKIISIIIALCIGLCIYYVAFALLFLIPGITAPVVYVLSILLGLAGIVLLWKFPEWYVIDIVGLICAAGCAVIFGISLSPLPVLVLLIVLIVYDYISVNHTKHMLKLADGVMQQKMPIMFLIPKTKGYSYRKNGFNISARREERSAYMIGLGDMIIPGILVVSAQVFASGSEIFGVSLPALGALAGSLIGVILLAIPMKSGKPQPGLPLINGCAIIGFLLCCAVSGNWDWLFVSFW
ncbi:MAG TPA: presenilin family intramembrane aspartyl protease [Methanocorpusculum sp.]|nr:presenilin family intramembrane aspartyl protease [Methanocorpusculum sp.]